MTETDTTIRIAPEVLATIVNLTTMSVPGIVAMAICVGMMLSLTREHAGLREAV